MPREDQVETLEQGDIFFFYRPRVEEHEPEGRADIQRFHMVLRPEGRRRYRLCHVGTKRLPDPSQRGKQRFWAFVDLVADSPKAIRDGLAEETYETKTRGTRTRPAARPAGEGVYRIVRHGDHTHLVYALELPKEPAEVQEELGIEEEASYIVSVANPERASPPQAGLGPEQRASYPRKLAERFRDRQFGELDPPDYLNHEGCELVLIPAAADVAKELGIELRPERETQSSAEVFKELRVRQRHHPTEPLLRGEWA